MLETVGHVRCSKTKEVHLSCEIAGKLTTKHAVHLVARILLLRVDVRVFLLHLLALKDTDRGGILHPIHFT